MQSSKILNKTQSDLQFIERFQSFCISNNFRLVVYGGYGLDGYFRKITRDHGDIDLVIYGSNTHDSATKSISGFIKSLYPNATIKQIKNLFQEEIFANDSGFGLNLYYVQTRDNPFINIHAVIKTDGEIVTNDPLIFPPPKPGSLEGVELEVQDQGSHLKDILAKGGASETKYITDLQLLSSLPFHH
ncbi:MAG: hypothetical protein WAV40_03220 [Microgenomates group bacterium]